MAHQEIRDQSDSKDIDTLWEIFKSRLLSSISKYVPHRTASAHDRPPWITQKVKKLLKARDHLFKKIQHKPSDSRKEKLKSLKKSIRKTTREAYWSYTENLITETGEDYSKNKNKKLWTFIKHRKTDSIDIAPLKENGLLKDTSREKAEILNAQFSSVFTTDDPSDFPDQTPWHEDLRHPDIADIQISEDGVEKLLKDLNPHKAMGPDGLHPRILKQLASTIAPTLQVIFQKSINTGRVPSDWKQANVSPIFKKGERYNAANYRPVSLTCICSKLLEHIVTKHLVSHLEENNILYNLQHGFRSKRSTESQLLAFTQDILSNLKSGKQTDVIIMDFAKAFDKVSYWRLAIKLKNYGVTGQVHKWIVDFLHQRSQRVVCKGNHSKWAPVHSGVPQGSVIGPILFLIYINDLPEEVNTTVRLFADDTIMYMAMSGPGDSTSLQQDLDRLAAWEEKWKMEFHPQKCSVLPITRSLSPQVNKYQLHGHTLKTETDSKYLGITINNKLSWNNHIDNTCTKANSSIGFLRRNFQIPQEHIKTNVYNTLVRPQVEYAAAVWDPYTGENIHKLEMVQRRAARYVCNNYIQMASVTGMLQKLGWQSLEQRRADIRLVFLFKSISGLVAVDLSDQLVRQTRPSRHCNSMAYHIPVETKTYIQKSFLPRTLNQWNRLPEAIVQSASLDAFKEGVSGITH